MTQGISFQSNSNKCIGNMTENELQPEAAIILFGFHLQELRKICWIGLYLNNFTSLLFFRREVKDLKEKLLELKDSFHSNLVIEIPLYEFSF